MDFSSQQQIQSTGAELEFSKSEKQYHNDKNEAISYIHYFLVQLKVNHPPKKALVITMLIKYCDAVTRFKWKLPPCWQNGDFPAYSCHIVCCNESHSVIGWIWTNLNFMEGKPHKVACSRCKQRQAYSDSYFWFGQNNEEESRPGPFKAVHLDSAWALERLNDFLSVFLSLFFVPCSSGCSVTLTLMGLQSSTELSIIKMYEFRSLGCMKLHGTCNTLHNHYTNVM